MATLIEVCRNFEDFERSRVASIRVATGDSGYVATFSIKASLPIAEESPIEGIDLMGFSRFPDIAQLLDWRIPAWEQIIELVHDREMALATNFGNMQAVEKSGAINTEMDKVWIIATHGPPRSPERMEWMERINAP